MPTPERPKKLALTLSTIKELDFGKIQAAFDAALSRCVADCEDRPGEKKPREVKLVFRMIPKVDYSADGNTINLEGVYLGCEITDNVPKRRTRIYEMKPTKIADGHGLTFHPEFPTDADATGLYDTTGEEVDTGTGEVKTKK